MLPPALRLAVFTLVLCLTPACVDDATTPGESGSADLVVLAQDIDFDRDAYTLTDGTVVIDYVLDGSLPHTLLIEDESGTRIGPKLKVGDGAGALDTATVDLEPGAYTLFCDIAGHRSAGMEAELVVTAGSG